MKITYKELLDQPINAEFKHKFRLSMRAWDIGSQARSIAKVAQQVIDEDGENATIHASNVQKWMDEILDMVNDCMDIATDNKEGK